MSEGVTIGPWAVWVCNPKGPYQYWWKIKQYSLCLCTLLFHKIEHQKTSLQQSSDFAHELISEEINWTMSKLKSPSQGFL